VHILINRSTGKTLSDCYIEFQCEEDAMNALNMKKQGILKGRVVTLEWSSQVLLRGIQA
jgi:RNA recognition motif-containing protein